MTGKYLIKWSGTKHDVQKWAKDRGVKPGTLFPAPFQIADKPGGKKGRRIADGNAQLEDLYRLNGSNEKIMKLIIRIGGWLYNTTNNKHLISRLRGLFWWMNNHIPFDYKRGGGKLKGKQKAYREPVYCESNIVVVDKIKGKWAHITPGIAHLVQVSIGYGTRHPSTNVRWRVPAGWCELSKLEKL